jgi:hypothetical protein
MWSDDQAVFVTLGQAMAATNGYTAMQSSQLYITDGDLVDWAYGVHRIFAFTFELYPIISSIEGFYPPASAIPVQTERNRAAVLYLLANAGCPYELIGKAAERCANGRVKPLNKAWMPVLRK